MKNSDINYLLELGLKNHQENKLDKAVYYYDEVINRTNALMSEESILLRKKENDYLQEIFYKGAKQKGSY